MDKVQRFLKACEFLTRCQGTEDDPIPGTVAPWELRKSLGFQEDFHDTLQGVWAWARYRELSGDARFDSNVIDALSYIRDAFDEHVENPPEKRAKVTRLYDAAFMLLTEVQCQRSFGEWPLGEQSALCKDLLVAQAKICEGTDFIARHYTDPFFHLYCLLKWSKHHEDESFDVARDATDKGANFLVRSNFLVSMDKEPCPEGPGGHDFMSKGGAVLLALGEAGLYETRLRETLEKVLPLAKGCQEGSYVLEWPARDRDPSPFALSASWGLLSAIKAGPEVDGAMDGLSLVDPRAGIEQGSGDWRQYCSDLSGSLVHARWDEFERRNGGIGRSAEFAEAESWATFYLMYALDLMD